MLRDDVDNRQGTPMDVDNIDDDDKPWEPTGQTLTGKDQNGEDSLFILQRKGSAFRVVPKGKGKT